MWSAEAGASSGGLTVNLPVIGGGASFNGAGDDRATFEPEQGRVTRVSYGSAADLGPARDAACADSPGECAEESAAQPTTGPDRPAISRISLRFNALPKLSKSSATMTKAPGPPITLSR